jgi:hypothetical protein
MVEYDFLILQPNEFENLTRDLLQKREGVFIESFTIGRDGGIDLRFTSPKGKRQVIVQAKRYKDYAKLKNVLKDEVAKVRKLNLDRYILSTSVGLTPENKTEIKTMFSPYIKATKDILGKDDLNNLLGEYSEVEKQYYKLWLGSTAVLDDILNKRINNWSEMTLEEARKDVSLYVMNDSFERALTILKENRYVIISGIPGIGKTTLSRMLAYQILAKDYDEFIKVNSMDDASQKLQKGKKQVFFYDDFMGSSFLDIKEIGFENKLLSFIEKVKREPDKLFILATREYILAAAKRQYEKLALSKIDIAKCTIDLSSYTEEIRANILYNHLADAELPIEYIKALLDGKRYLRLIKHDNFNPRIIESFLKQKLYKTEKPEDFVKRFLDFFDRPYSVWEYAFSNMSKMEQYAMYVRATMGSRPVYLEDWHEAIYYYVNSLLGAVQADCLEEDWQNILKKLLGTFILTERVGDKDLVNYHNPSVYDFLIDNIRKNEKLQGKLISHAMFVNQLTGTFTDRGVESRDYGRIQISDDQADYVAATFRRQLEKPMTAKLDNRDSMWYKARVNMLSYINDMMVYFPVLFRQRPELLTDVVTQELFSDTDYGLDDRMALLDHVEAEAYGLNLEDVVDAVLPELKSGYDYVNTVSLMEKTAKGKQLMEDDDFVRKMEETLEYELESADSEEECEYVRDDVQELAKHYQINPEGWGEAIDDAKTKFAEPEQEYDDWDPGERYYGEHERTSDYYDLYTSLL